MRLYSSVMSVIVFAALPVACAHATKTASQEKSEKSSDGKKPDDKKAGEKKAEEAKAGGQKSEDKKGDGNKGEDKKASGEPASGKKGPGEAKQGKGLPRTEAIETSKTTKQMFKPEGLKKLQVALSAKSIDVDENGHLTSATQESILAFQKKQGLPATGLPDYETLRRLGVKPDDVYHREPPSERAGVQ